MSENKDVLQNETTVNEGGAPEVTASAELQRVYDLLGQYGLSINDELKQKLSEMGAESLDDLAYMDKDALVELGLKPLKANRLLGELKKMSEQEEPAQMPVSAPTNAGMPIGGMMIQPPYAAANGESLLPAVPDDNGWFDMLLCNDRLTMDRGIAVSAVVAMSFGYADVRSLPKKLADMMEKRDMERGLQSCATYWRLRNMSRARTYSDVLAAMAGGTAPGVTVADRKRVMERLERYVRPRFIQCYEAAEQVGKDATDLSVIFTGGANMPDIEPLYSAAEELRKGLNVALAGPGAVVVTDIAMDYVSMGKIFELDDLYERCGAADHDELLSMLNMGVTGYAVRSEKSIRRFMLAMIDLESVPVEKQIAFCQQLGQLVRKIDRRLIAGQDYAAASGNGEQVIEVEAEVVDDKQTPALHGQKGKLKTGDPKLLESVTGRTLPVE